MPADANPPNVPRPRRLFQCAPSIAAVTGAIKRAAQSTGANFDYLLTTPRSSRTSTPIRRYRPQRDRPVPIPRSDLARRDEDGGEGFGFGQYADAISQTSSGGMWLRTQRCATR